MVTHFHSPSFYQAEAEGLQARGQPRLHSVTLSEVGMGRRGREEKRKEEWWNASLCFNIHTYCAILSQVKHICLLKQSSFLLVKSSNVLPSKWKHLPEMKCEDVTCTLPLWKEPELPAVLWESPPGSAFLHPSPELMGSGQVCLNWICITVLHLDGRVLERGGHLSVPATQLA